MCQNLDRIAIASPSLLHASFRYSTSPAFQPAVSTTASRPRPHVPPGSLSASCYRTGSQPCPDLVHPSHPGHPVPRNTTPRILLHTLPPSIVRCLCLPSVYPFAFHPPLSVFDLLPPKPRLKGGRPARQYRVHHSPSSGSPHVSPSPHHRLDRVTVA